MNLPGPTGGINVARGLRLVLPALASLEDRSEPRQRFAKALPIALPQPGLGKLQELQSLHRPGGVGPGGYYVRERGALAFSSSDGQSRQIGDGRGHVLGHGYSPAVAHDESAKLGNGVLFGSKKHGLHVQQPPAGGHEV